MIARALAFAFALLCTLQHGLAQDLPAFYDVSGVAEDDKLNVREAPGVGNSIIDTLAADEKFVEVVALNDEGTWGQVNINEVSGWVSMDFLTRRDEQPSGQLPRPLACFGTEPFWSLDIARDATADFTRPEEDAVQITLLDPVTSANQTDRYAIFGQSGDSVYSFIFHRDTCNDGMSDRTYGISVDMLLTEEAGVSYVSGCCNLSR